MILTIKTDGVLVRKGLQDLGAEMPKIGRQPLRTRANAVVRTMQEYPSELPGQKYKRTGTLFSHWTIKEVSGGYQIGNDASRKGRRYGQYVVGDAYGTSQAKIHAGPGRWKLLRDVTEEEFAKLPPEVEEHITMVARRVGL